MAKIQKVFKNFVSKFLDPTGKDLLVLPHKIKKELSLSFIKDEEIISSMKTDRSIYRAGTSRDSNTFYKTFAVLTNRRIIIARDSSSLKIFRDFQVSQINGLLFEDPAKKPTIHIDLINSKYILSMPPGSHEEAKTFFNTLSSALEAVKSENNFCTKCGNKIQKDSVYCSHCGIKILETGNKND